ncbi:MAG TPA: CapA family protein [Planococcus sp. (in: firmicutes)]|nr:CapA family protein [Planococcus sp. (in: firmicutes)]
MITKKQASSIFILCIAMILSSCAPDIAVDASDNAREPFGLRTAPVATKEFEQTRTASLSAVGDILLHGRVYDTARTEDGFDFDPMFDIIRPYMEAADITFANSESIIGGSEIGVSTYPSFNSPYEIADALKNAGVDVVSMSNNHTLDRGVRAIENAKNYWNEIGIASVGSYLSYEERDEVTLIARNGITFSFLAYTYATNGVPTPAGREYLVNRINKEQIQRDLSRAKEQSDVVVLSLHFGEEYERMPSAEQIDLANFSAEHGADIILGHHPHVLQPPEWIETSDGSRSFVVYSLGNFLSGQDLLYRQIGGILHIEVEKVIDSNSETITLKNPGFTNTFVRSANHTNYEIDLLEKVDPKINEEIKAHLSQWIPELAFIE